MKRYKYPYSHIHWTVDCMNFKVKREKIGRIRKKTLSLHSHTRNTCKRTTINVHIPHIPQIPYHTLTLSAQVIEIRMKSHKHSLRLLRGAHKHMYIFLCAVVRFGLRFHKSIVSLNIHDSRHERSVCARKQVCVCVCEVLEYN